MAISKIHSKGTIAMVIALLSGCTTLGHVYPFPTGSDPSAGAEGGRWSRLFVDAQ